MVPARVRTQIYIVVVSLIVSLLGMAIMRSKPGGQSPKAMTASQSLAALEKTVPPSSDTARFLQREKAAQDANDEAGKELAR